METKTILSSSLPRKPLSDCSNTAIIKPSINQTPSLKSHPYSYTSTASNFSPDISTFSSHSLAPPTPLFSSDDRNHVPTVGNQMLDTKARKDGSEETPIFELLSSGASHNCHLSWPPTLKSKSGDAQPRKNEKASEPVTPHAARLITVPSACGTHNHRRPNLPANNQRKSPRIRRHADGKTILPLSCPPGKRTKKKGHSNWVKHEDAGVEKQLGSLSDPLPLHEKKRYGKKQDDDAMHGLPQEEIDRLRSYYADVDAFVLPEEVAPELDSD